MDAQLADHVDDRRVDRPLLVRAPGRRVTAFGDAVLAEDGLHPLPRVDDRDLASLGPVPWVIAVLVRAQEGDGQRLEIGAFVSASGAPSDCRRP